MRIRTVTVGRLRNLGNYENLKVELTAEVGQGEKPQKVIHDLDNMARVYLGQATIEEEQAREVLCPSERLYHSLGYHCRQLEELAQRVRRGKPNKAHDVVSFRQTREIFAEALASWHAEEARPEVCAARALLRLAPPLPPEAPTLPEAEPAPAPPPAPEEIPEDGDAPTF